MSYLFSKKVTTTFYDFLVLMKGAAHISSYLFSKKVTITLLMAINDFLFLMRGAAHISSYLFSKKVTITLLMGSPAINDFLFLMRAAHILFSLCTIRTWYYNFRPPRKGQTWTQWRRKFHCISRKIHILCSILQWTLHYPDPFGQNSRKAMPDKWKVRIREIKWPRPFRWPHPFI